MSTLWQNISSKTRQAGSKLYLIIGVNLIIFLIALLFPAITNYLRLTANLNVLKIYFWTPLTNMIVNDGFMSIIFNMLWLYWMGQIFEDFLGYRRTLGLYLMGGFTGSVLFVLSSNTLPLVLHHGFLLVDFISGATVSVLTIAVATATLLPDHPVRLFIWTIRLKWLVLIYGISDILNISNLGAPIAIAHLGAALLGFVYIKRLHKGHDWVANIVNIFNRGPKLSPLKVAARNKAKKETGRPRQEEVDTILDKISKVGYESLSKEEKEILFRASKNES